MSVFMFPGQGAQVKGMGADLFTQFPAEVAVADEILGYSISELCLQDPEQKLAKTAYTQPALFVVEALAFKATSTDAAQSHYLIGHSIGEYAALFTAGAFDFATGLKLVQKRGELMAQAHSGGMLAVINLSLERIESLLATHQLDTIDVANFNSKTQVVLSGPAKDIERAGEILSQEAMMCVPLNTSGAFHSRYMHEAADTFAQFLNEFTFYNLNNQVISNVTATPYTDETIKEYLTQQIYSRWRETPINWFGSINCISMNIRD